MGNSLVINGTRAEVRVALLEDRVPVELYIERSSDRGVVGNIYLGRVVRVLPGMQAAFVDVGLERTGFLYVNEAVLDSDDDPTDVDGGGAQGSHGGRRSRGRPVANIGDVLKQGQEILVQVQKEPLGTKGARLTRHVTLPGRHLVLMPFSRHVGISHRIESDAERERLRVLATTLAPEGQGLIVRTAAEGADEQSLDRDARFLTSLWADLEERAKHGGAPRMILEDLDLILRSTRDLFTDEVDRIIVDRPEDAERLRRFISSFAPKDVHKVELYSGHEPIFDHFGVEVEIQRALDRRVWLKSGGYIVIDQAEALTVIDVNSGRFVGKSSLEETITQINLEAVKEVAYQLRLRNIGGIVIIDFIDMNEPTNREKVLSVLEEALRSDRAKSTIVRMSEIGLVEMTRKRVRESLGDLLTDGCPYCKGRGRVKSRTTVGHEILRALVRTLKTEPAQKLLVNMDPEVADFLYEGQGWLVEELEAQFGTTLIPVARDGYHREQFEIVRSSDRQ